MYTSIVAASQTLRDYLTSDLRADLGLRNFFDPAFGGTMVVSLNTPDEMAELNQEGISLWLYRVVRDEDLLNAPPTRISPTSVRRTPLPVRLHYLVAPLVSRNTASGSELEQTLLGKVLLLFHDHPQFRGPDLTGDFTGDLTVELTARLETISLEEITRVWDSLESSYELSVSYEVTVVALRSEVLENVVPVREVMPQTGLIVDREELV